jgi:hypothetical protein
MIDGLNREVAGGDLAKTYEMTSTVYRSVGAEGQLQLGGDTPPDAPPARWMLRGLRAD